MSDIHPMDQFNKKLINNVRPQDYQNPYPKDNYSLVVIGGGTAGLVTAAGAAGLGASVALVERRFMGGDCLNYGCVPSKSIIAASRENKIALQKNHTGDPKAFEEAMEKMRNNRARISDNDSVKRFNELGVDVFLGDAKFISKNSMEVTGQQLNFTKAVIATGGRPRELVLPGLEKEDYHTNESIFNMTEKPEKMAVIGAGPIGCELAQAFQNLGVKVTIFQREAQILPREDRDAAEIVYQQLLKDGVAVELGTDLKKVDKRDNKKYLVYEKNGQEETKGVDAILVGIGRIPNIENMGLDKAGVDSNRQGIIVNDKLQTTNRKIFAVGDCCMKYKFTHAADAAARIVISNALFLGKQKLSDLIIPWCTYTEPEIAHVGLYPHDAEDKGVEIDTYEQSFAQVDRAITDGEESGLIKVHTKKGSDKILGATIVAANAGDMISEITTAMVCNIGLKTLSGVIHPYPTQAEAVKKIADAYNRTRLTPFAQKILKYILKITG